jgi:hypothetical protein
MITSYDVRIWSIRVHETKARSGGSQSAPTVCAGQWPRTNSVRASRPRR